jgi:hypothetical protein
MEEATRQGLEPLGPAVPPGPAAPYRPEARAAVLRPQLERLAAARAEFEGEIDALEVSLKDAFDVRRNGPKLAAVGAGSAFLLLGGPQRILRRLLGRRKEVSPPLPKEIEKLVRSLGPDGDTVRATLEQEFAAFLKSRGVGKGRIGPPTGMRHTFWRIVDGVSKPVTARAGRRLAERLFSGDGRS